MPEPERDQITRIFRYLKQLDEMRNPAVRQLKNHPAHFALDGLPEHPCITRTDDSEEAERPLLLRVRSADLACPSPPTVLDTWLKPGWQELNGEVAVLEEVESLQAGGVVHRIFFHDEKERPERLAAWKLQREAWAKGELAAQVIYERLMQIHSEVDKEGEQVEFVIGTGLLDNGELGVCHPLLLQQATMDFTPDEPAFTVRLADEAPELYEPLLRSLPGMDDAKVRALSAGLAEQSFDLTNTTATADAVMRLGAALSTSLGDGLVLIVRQRTLGYQRAVDLLLKEIAAGAALPGAFTRVVGLEPDEAPAASVFTEEGEDQNVLLSKAANEEQFRIARRLERSSAVLVQGPPGTGKTHTIANLLGHLLAEGKSVLVTSHTSKALRVLRDMVVAPLRPLCLTVLDNDADNRSQLHQTVETIAARLSDSDAETLQREAADLGARRKSLLAEMTALRQRLFSARLAEAQPVLAGGQTFTPIEAARLHREGLGVHEWVPGAITPQIPAPLTQIEVAFLYESNAMLSPADEQVLWVNPPDIEKLPAASEFAMLMAEQARLAASAAQDRPELWIDTSPPLRIEQLDALQPRVSAAANTIRGASGWWQEVVRAGRQGGVTRQVWEEFAAQIEALVAESDELQPALMGLDPQIQPAESEDRGADDLTLLREIISHLKTGRGLGVWSKTMRRPWHRFIDRAKISAKPPETLEHFETLLAFAILCQKREALRSRWQRQVSAAGGPDASTLGPQPERAALPIVHDIRERLDWHGKDWAPLLEDLGLLGFQWDTYASSIVMDRNEFGDLARFRQAVSGPLPTLIRARRDALRLAEVTATVNEIHTLLQDSSDSPLTQRLMTALAEHDAYSYSEICRDVARLSSRKIVAAKRRELLARLDKDAPMWAALFRSRTAPHDGKRAPEDFTAAWQWRQIANELERRAKTDIQQTQVRLEELQAEFTHATAQLVERRAWAARKKRLGLKEQAALEGYVGCLQKITKSGQGRRDAALMAAAREHLKTARRAVPVWIMPLSRVYESFFPDEGSARFDVVIIDEASQSDVSALAALFLGEKAIIVGDEEQVTPTPFADLERVQRMISTTLVGVPNRELYDPETSIYHLARAFYQERIMLREHFRCVPEIIQFSNDLSYDRRIRPLRESGTSPVPPPLIAHRVKGAVNDKKINVDEAEEIAALLMSCLEQPEYDLNDVGEPTTYGVISLLGDEQAVFIESLLLARIPPVEFEKRRIICGNASQFQGDERDVMFLSLVDAGEGTAQPMRGFGPREIFRKRFNVAASRARNQVWVVHSLDPVIDLQPGDLRRRLIEHAMNPVALMGEMEREIPSNPMQRDVQAWLVERHYTIASQWPVGACRIGLVVRGGKKHLAVECDGDRLISSEELSADMDRQATLERLGWTFARVRASHFYRDPEAAMQPVLQALERVGIFPSEPGVAKPSPPTLEVLDRVRLRAPEIRWMWGQRAKTRVIAARTEAVKAAPEAVSPAPAEPAAPQALPPPPSIVVETGDWVEFILSHAPKEAQFVNIVSGPTDVDQSTINAGEPLAQALMGLAVNEKGSLSLGGAISEIEVLKIHKPRKPHSK